MADAHQKTLSSNGLTRVEPSLPTHFYLDADPYALAVRARAGSAAGSPPLMRGDS